MLPVYITYINKHAKRWLALNLVHMLNPSHNLTGSEIQYLHSCRNCHFLHSFLFYSSRLNDRQGCQRTVAFDFLSHRSPPVQKPDTGRNTECVQYLDSFFLHSQNIKQNRISFLIRGNVSLQCMYSGRLIHFLSLVSILSSEGWNRFF